MGAQKRKRIRISVDPREGFIGEMNYWDTRKV
jgi:hypothetical protein